MGTIFLFRRICFLLLLFLCIHLNPCQVSAQVQFSSSNLPIIIIDTNGDQIESDQRIPAEMKVIAKGRGQRNQVTDSPTDYDGKIMIELRGSATLNYPKKSYRFETQNDFGGNRNVELCGMPKENDWILYGPYDDQSLIRNVMAYRLSNEIGAYASRVRMCEVVLNGDYRGVYILTEKIKRDKNRVDVTEMSETDISGDEVTGGYIIKIDKWSGENVDGWRSSMRVEYQYHYPKADEITSEQKTYIRNYMNKFEITMSGNNISNQTTGYPAYIDVDSFVDHFIMNELGKNVDAYRISFFMHKDRDSKGGKLHAGPIWDFNLSFGKAWYDEDLFRVEGWEVDHNDYKPYDSPKVPFWWENLGHDCAFARKARSRWISLREGILSQKSLFRRIDLLVDSLAEARFRNFERWPESEERFYAQEIQMMKNWIVDRLEWIDEDFDELVSAAEAREAGRQSDNYYILQNYPNPFNPFTTIEFKVTQTEHVQLLIYDITGRKIKTLVNAVKSPGSYSIVWDGTNNQAQSVASGLYFCRFEAGSEMCTIKLALVK